MGRWGNCPVRFGATDSGNALSEGWFHFSISHSCIPVQLKHDWRHHCWWKATSGKSKSPLGLLTCAEVILLPEISDFTVAGIPEYCSSTCPGPSRHLQHRQSGLGMGNDISPIVHSTTPPHLKLSGPLCSSMVKICKNMK